MNLLVSAGVISVSGALTVYCWKKSNKVRADILSTPIIEESSSTSTSTSSSASSRYLLLGCQCTKETGWNEIYKKINKTYLSQENKVVYDFSKSELRCEPAIVSIEAEVNQHLYSFSRVTPVSCTNLLPSFKHYYSYSMLDQVVEIPKSGYDLIKTLYNSPPPPVSIDTDKLYIWKHYSGFNDGLVYFYGKKSGSQFIFHRFGRDPNNVLLDEAIEQTKFLDFGSFCGITTMICAVVCSCINS